MKKVIIISLLLPFFVHAQTIPGSSFPVIGSMYALIRADTAGVQPGSGGTGRSWDYSSLINNGTQQVDTYMSPSATPYGSLFPTADIAVHETAPNTDYYVYYHNDGNEYQRIANVQPDTVTYQNPANEFPYPVSYGNMFNDTYYSSYTSSGTPVHMAGSTVLNADGSGTLMLPTGTFEGILRCTGTRDEHDTILGSPTIFVHLFSTYYNWYQTMTYYPLLSIMITDVNYSTGLHFHSKTVGYRGSSVGINDLLRITKAIEVTPNPSATGVFHLTFNDAKLQIKTIEVTDITGRIIFTASGNVNEINLGNSVNGFYFYHVLTADGNSYSGKIMKE